MAFLFESLVFDRAAPPLDLSFDGISVLETMDNMGFDEPLADAGNGNGQWRPPGAGAGQSVADECDDYSDMRVGYSSQLIGGVQPVDGLEHDRRARPPMDWSSTSWARDR